MLAVCWKWSVEFIQVPAQEYFGNSRLSVPSRRPTALVTISETCLVTPSGGSVCLVLFTAHEGHSRRRESAQGLHFL